MEEIHQICSRKNGNWRCKNVSGDNKLQYCDKHYKKKMEIEEKKKLPLDERFCCVTAGGGWRCKNLRMSHGAAGKSKQCEKHYYYYANYTMNKEKKRNGDCEETRGWKRRREKVSEENEIQKLRATSYNDTSDAIIEEVGTANIRRKRKNVQRTKGFGEPESSKRTREPVADSARYKTKCFELSMELEKKKVEFIKLHGELSEVTETRKTLATEETEGTPADAIECWKEIFLDLERRFLRMEYINSNLESLVLKIKKLNLAKAGCVESPISVLESQVLKSGNRSSTLTYAEIRNSKKIGSEAWGLQNAATPSGGKEKDETSCGGNDYSRMCKLKTKEEVLDMYGNIEEGKYQGCSEERSSLLESSFQDHLEPSKKLSLNLISDDNIGESQVESEDSGSSADTETSLGELMDMLAMKYTNRNEDHGYQTAGG